MRVIHTITTTANIGNIPVIDGQILALWDTDAWYYDMAGQRRSVSGVRFVEELPPVTEGIENVIYVVGLDMYKFTAKDGFTLLSNIDDSTSSPASTYSSDKIDQLLDLYVPKSEKGQPEGVASLDEDGVVPESQLPSWCRALIVVPDYSDLPAVGDETKAYLVKNDNRFFQWIAADNNYKLIGLLLGHDPGTAYPGDEGFADHNAIQVIDGKITALISRVAANESAIHNLQLSVTSLQSQIDEIPINYLVNVNNVDTDLAVALAILDKPSYHNADILVLVDGSRQTKAYVYDADIPDWVELSGGITIHYDSDNIYFNRDILCAGNYTQVGNLKKSLTGITTIPATNKSLSDVMDYIFKRELQPTKVDPSISITVSASPDIVEVGDECAPEYSVSYNNGSYTYNSDTGVSITDLTVQDYDRTYVYHTPQGQFPPIPVIHAQDQYALYHTCIEIQGIITYTDGNIASSNIGRPSDPPVQITAGSVSDAGFIEGRRSMFYGVLDASATLDAQTIRDSFNNVIDYESQKGKTFVVNVDASGVFDPVAIIVAIPNAGPTDVSITKVIAEDYVFPDITSMYDLLEETIDIPGANNFTPVSYKIYRYETGNLLFGEIHNITLG